jgi:hypothetical protein
LIKKKTGLLWIFMFIFAIPFLGWPLIALAAYDQYMPQQEELPGGFQLKGFHEDNHDWYGDTAFQGEWELNGIVYRYSWENVPDSNANQIETMGWMSQKDIETNILIHVAIGEKTPAFINTIDNLANGGVGDLPINCNLLAKGNSISLDAGEDKAVRFEGGLPGYCFIKGDVGVIVAPGGGYGADPWVLQKLGGNPQDFDKVLFTMAQSIAQSIPGKGQTQGGVPGGGTSSGSSKTNNELPSATILLATALSGLVLTGGALVNVAINRPRPAGPMVNQQMPQGAPYIGEERNGQVWYKPPWDQGGPGWINKAEYNQIQNMTAQGKVWSDRWGWVDPHTLQQNEASRARNWASFIRQDAIARTATEAINKYNRGYNQSLQNILNNQRRYDIEINQINNLRQARIDANSVARWEKICKTTEAISWTADQTINIMGKVVPGGGYISDGYTVLKGTAEGLGNAMAEGGNYSRHLAKGTFEGAVNLAKDKAQEGAFNALKRIGRR